MSRFWLTAVCGLPLVLFACSAPQTTATEPAFKTDPLAPTPRIQIEWRENVDTASVGEYRARQYASPTIHRTADRRELIVGTQSGRVSRYRASDGRKRWERKLDGPVHASPTATSKRVYVATLYGTLYAIDRKTGNVDWKVENDREIESPAAVADGLVFYTTNAGRLVAIDESSGEETWTYSRSIPKEFTVKGSGTPVTAGHAVYCGFADGTVVSLDTRTGAENWTTNVAGSETEYTDVDGPVVIRQNRVYVTSYGAGVSALERKTGEAIWSRSFSNVSSTAYAEGTIYLTMATGRVVAISARDGSGIWGVRLDEHLPVDVSAVSSYLFVSTGSGPLYVLDRSTGYPLTRWKASTGVNTAVKFSERAGYFLSNKGFLYSFRLAF